MSNFLKTAALLLLTALSVNANAQTISAADQKGIEECYNAFMSAFEKLDATSIPSLLTENAEHIIPTGEIFRGRANVSTAIARYMEFLKTQPKPDRVEQKQIAWQSRYLATDVIMSTYTDETTLHFGDKTRVEKMTTAIVVRKVDGKWLAELIALTPVPEMPKH